MSQIVFTDNYKVVQKTVTHSTHTTKAIPSVLILFTHSFSNFTIIKIITVFITNLIIADLLKETQKKRRSVVMNICQKDGWWKVKEAIWKLNKSSLTCFFFNTNEN